MESLNWISNYKVEVAGENGINVVTGDFVASAGSFRIEYTEDGGNSDTYHIILSDGQFDTGFGRPVSFTIVGAWEIREVIEMFKLLGNIISRE